MESGIVILIIGGNGSNMILFPSLFRERHDRAKGLSKFWCLTEVINLHCDLIGSTEGLVAWWEKLCIMQPCIFYIKLT